MLHRVVLGVLEPAVCLDALVCQALFAISVGLVQPMSPQRFVSLAEQACSEPEVDSRHDAAAGRWRDDGARE